MDEHTDKTKIAENERLSYLKDADVRDNAKFAPGSFGFHEALHAASMLTGMAEEHLLKHPAILLHSDLYRRAHDIHAALFDLYQAIGEKHLSDQTEEPTGAP